MSKITKEEIERAKQEISQMFTEIVEVHESAKETNWQNMIYRGLDEMGRPLVSKFDLDFYQQPENLLELYNSLDDIDKLMNNKDKLKEQIDILTDLAVHNRINDNNLILSFGQKIVALSKNNWGSYIVDDKISLCIDVLKESSEILSSDPLDIKYETYEESLASNRIVELKAKFLENLENNKSNSKDL